MVGIVYRVETARIERAARALAGLLSSGEIQGEISGILKSQTQRRLTETKIAPDGTPWPEWSEEYAQTRGAHHSLLEGDGDLVDSIMTFADRSAAGVGSPLVYAAIQQFGGEEVGMDIPARAYLGLSSEDAAEIEQIVADMIAEELQ